MDISPPTPTLYLFLADLTFPEALSSIGDYQIILTATDVYTDVFIDVEFTIKIVCAPTLSITPPVPMQPVIHDLNKTNYEPTIVTTGAFAQIPQCNYAYTTSLQTLRLYGTVFANSASVVTSVVVQQDQTILLTIDQTNLENAGTYNLKLTVSSSQPYVTVTEAVFEFELVLRKTVELPEITRHLFVQEESQEDLRQIFKYDQSRPEISQSFFQEPSYEYACTTLTGQLNQDADSCCGLAFQLASSFLKSKKQVSIISHICSFSLSAGCDGSYKVTVTASSPQTPQFILSQAIIINLRFQCINLSETDIFVESPKFYEWQGDEFSQQALSYIEFSAFDQKELAVALQLKILNPFSCKLRFNFTCKPESANCNQFDAVFSQGQQNLALKGFAPTYLQLKKKAHSNHLPMVFNESNILMNVYVYQGDSLTDNSVDYTGITGYKKVVQVEILCIVKNSCSTLRVAPDPSDLDAQLRNNAVISTTVSDPLLSRKFLIVRSLGLIDAYDSQYCGRLSFFLQKISQAGARAVDSFFQVEMDPTLKITMIAVSNAQVIDSDTGCRLSGGEQFTQECAFNFEVEAKIGTYPSFMFARFQIKIRNECYNLQQPLENFWIQSQTGKNLPDKFVYRIYFDASISYFLPRARPVLPSEALNQGFPTAQQECMRQTTYTYTSVQNLAALDNPSTPDGFPSIRILTTDYKLAGTQRDIDQLKLYPIDLGLTITLPAKTFTFSYASTSSPQKLSPLQFLVQNKCLNILMKPKALLTDLNTKATKEFVLDESTQIQVSVGQSVQLTITYDALISKCGEIAVSVEQEGFFVTYRKDLSSTQTLVFDLSPTKANEVRLYNLLLLFRTGFVENTLTISIPVSVQRTVDSGIIMPKVEVQKLKVMLGQQQVLDIPKLQKLTHPNAKWAYAATLYEIQDLDQSIKTENLPMLKQGKVKANIKGNQVLIKIEDNQQVGKTFTCFIDATLDPDIAKASFELARLQVEAQPVTEIIAASLSEATKTEDASPDQEPLAQQRTPVEQQAFQLNQIQKLLDQKPTKQDQSEIRIISISTFGEMKAYFKQPMKVPSQFSKRRALSGLNQAINMMEIGTDSDKKQVESFRNLDFNITQFTQSWMTIELNMTEHNQSSNLIMMEILDPTQFIDLKNQMVKKQSMLYELPAQIIPGSAEETVSEVIQVAGSSAQTVMTGNLVLNLFLFASLNHIWSLVEAQQIIALMPVLNIRLPALPAVIISKFLEIANFDILPIATLWTKIFKMAPCNNLASRFQTVGMESNHFTGNMGSLFVSLLVAVLLMLLATLSYPFRHIGQNRSGRCLAFWKWLRSVAFFSFPLKVMMEMFMCASINVLLTIQNPNWKDTGQRIDTLIAFAMAIAIPVYLFFAITIIFVHRRHSELSIKYYEPLFVELDTSNGWIVFQRLVFFSRRLIIAVAVVCVETFIWQMFLMFFQSILALITTGMLHAFSSNEKWKNELGNEVVILLSIYFTFCFTDFVAEPKASIIVGYGFCALLGIHTAYSVLRILASQVYQNVVNLKRQLFLKKHLALRKQRHQRIDKLSLRKSIKIKGTQKLESYEQQLDKDLFELDQETLLHFTNSSIKKMFKKGLKGRKVEATTAKKSEHQSKRLYTINEDDADSPNMSEEVLMVFGQAKLTEQIEVEKQADSFVDTWDQVDTTEIENEHHSRNRSVDMLIQPASSTELMLRDIVNNNCSDDLVMEFVQNQVETKAKAQETKEKVLETKPTAVEIRKNSAASKAILEETKTRNEETKVIGTSMLMANKFSGASMLMAQLGTQLKKKFDSKLEEEKFGVISRGNSEMLFMPIGMSHKNQQQRQSTETGRQKEEKKSWGLQTLASIQFGKKRLDTKK